jgi:hypothetical protein
MFRPSAPKLSFNLVPAGNHPTNVSLHSRTKGRNMIHFVGKLMRHTGLASPSQAHTSPSLPGQPEAQTRSTIAQVPSCDKLPQAISGPRFYPTSFALRHKHCNCATNSACGRGTQPDACTHWTHPYPNSSCTGLPHYKSCQEVQCTSAAHPDLPHFKLQQQPARVIGHAARSTST